MTLRLAKAIERVVQAPSWPNGIERTPRRRAMGIDYETNWARSPAARLVRAALFDHVARPLALGLSSAKVIGLERLDALSGPVIFAANHSSHLDTSIVLSSLPLRFRHKTVVAAAADYFFDRPWKAALFSLTLGTIPVERTRVNRKSADLAAGLIEKGWNLVIFPEGARTEDGWGQEFRGGAAYLAKRCAVPVVPIHLRGVRPMLPKGKAAFQRGRVEVRFGEALYPKSADGGGREEDARRFANRVEKAVAALGDEAESDWWIARRRFHAESTPAFRGPVASPWRRAWALPKSQRSYTTKRQSSARPW